MKKFMFVVLALAMVMTVSAAPAKNVPAFIGIHVGPPNPAFVESLYPDVKFYYLPEIQVSVTKDKKDFFNGTGKIVSGEGLVVDWFKEKGFLAYPRYIGLLFDKTGVCVYEGFLQVNAKSSTDERFMMENNSINFTDKKALKESLDSYVQKGKTLKLNAKKNLIKDKDYVGGPAPDITVMNAMMEPFKLSELLAGKPTMVFFFSIPTDATPEEVSITNKSAAVADSATNAASPGAFIGAMLKGVVASNDTYTAVLDQIELDFFGYLVNKPR